VHNLLKVHRAGGLDLIREPNRAPANAPAEKRRALATLAHSFAARFRRSLATISATGFARRALLPVTDTGS